MVLLERDQALASLAEYARSAAVGQGRLVLVPGEAGVGKTALLEAFRDVTADFRWLTGACDGLFTPRPLAPLFDVAEQAGDALREACDAGALRERLFALLLRDLRESDAATVLVIEDAHWADESTLDLIRFLSRRIRDLPVLLVVTYRDDALGHDHPLRILLGEVATLRPTRRLSVAPLSVRGVAALAEGTGLEAGELFRLTGGNPFFVTEVVQGGRSGDVPRSAADAVLARLARLDPHARQVVRCAALIGGRIEPWLLEEVSSQPPSAVDDAVSSGLLVSDGAAVRFRHELARLAVEDEIAPHRRGAVHAAILAALVLGGCTDSARLAYHAEGADNADAVLRFAPSAAQQASVLRSHREAAIQYERALRFADGRAPAELAELYDGLHAEYSLVDRFEDARIALENALELWRRCGNTLREGDAMWQMAKILWRLCRGEESVASSQAALTILEPLGPTRELGWAYAIAGASDTDVHRSLQLTQRARQLAEELSLPDLESYALNTEACILATAGEEWDFLMQRALRIALEGGDAERAARAYANLNSNYIVSMRLAESERYYDEGLPYCEEQDMSTYATCLRGWHANALDLQGRWDEAVAICEPALCIISSPVNRLTSLFALGRIRARRGEHTAWQCLDEALLNATGVDEAEWIGRARLCRAEAHWLAGDLDEARAEAGAARDLCPALDPWTRGAVATWLRRVGAASDGVTGPVAEPYRLSLAGDFTAAAAEWDRRGCPYEAALALHDAQTEAAVREALNRFDALGATAAVQVTRQALRRLGVRSIPVGSRQATRAHPAGLTPRESEVLDLLCAGHTNGEISVRLVISAKTVDHHVSAVLAKLGVPTRAHAAAEAARRGLVVAQPG
jgi:DNA-binding CsgD family transcriptional regulator/tetratricopeptide (TPR) repeat protein